MEKRIFTKRFVYVFSLSFFFFAGLFFIPFNIQPFATNFGYEHTIFIILIVVFALAVLLCLLNKEKVSVRLMNIYLLIILLSNIKSFLSLFFNKHYDYSSYYYKAVLTFMALLLLYFGNKYKSNSETSDEIDKIGKE